MDQRLNISAAHLAQYQGDWNGGHEGIRG